MLQISPFFGIERKRERKRERERQRETDRQTDRNSSLLEAF